MPVKKKKNQKKELAKWEKEFIPIIEAEGSEDAKEILRELEDLLEITSQTAKIKEEEQEAEERKKHQLNQVKNLESRIEYTDEQKEISRLQPKMRDLEKKMKDKKDILNSYNDEDRIKCEKEIADLKAELNILEEKAKPLHIIVNGLQRKAKTLNNRIDRSVFSGFGSIIKNRRDELGLSLKQIELETGISPSYINRIEKGERKAPSFHVIEQLAKALDLPVGKLINLAEVEVKEDVPSLEELILTSQFTVNQKRASKQAKEKMVEFIKRLHEASGEPDKKYEEFIKLMSYFDYFKDTFSTNKNKNRKN